MRNWRSSDEEEVEEEELRLDLQIVARAGEELEEGTVGVGEGGVGIGVSSVEEVQGFRWRSDEAESLEECGLEEVGGEGGEGGFNSGRPFLVVDDYVERSGFGMRVGLWFYGDGVGKAAKVVVERRHGW
ncbi:hypothetical protein Sjap_022355 [Stephania japonica]|uniref:Uncharacterized protein n=1 Tax=Stephania japonica TaxID=461633 RepID=A0AAP0EUG1_9MAGN